MAISRYIMHQKNASGTYDDVYLKSESGLIYRPSGRTVEQDLSAYLPEVQDSDVVPESLPFGTNKYAKNVDSHNILNLEPNYIIWRVA